MKLHLGCPESMIALKKDKNDYGINIATSEICSIPRPKLNILHASGAVSVKSQILSGTVLGSSVSRNTF